MITSPIFKGSSYFNRLRNSIPQFRLNNLKISFSAATFSLHSNDTRSKFHCIIDLINDKVEVTTFRINMLGKEIFQFLAFAATLHVVGCQNQPSESKTQIHPNQESLRWTEQPLTMQKILLMNLNTLVSICGRTSMTQWRRYSWKYGRAKYHLSVKKKFMKINTRSLQLNSLIWIPMLK